MLKTAGLSTSGLAILLIVYRVLKAMKGKRLVSSCCGKKIEVGVDIEEMTPKQITINNPIPNLDNKITIEIPNDTRPKIGKVDCTDSKE